MPQADAPKTDSRRRLRDLVAERSLLKGTDIKLASGARSSFYFDMKRSSFDPEGANLISELMLEKLAGEQVDYVGGLEMGAVPLVACLCQKSWGRRPAPLRGFFVRKQAKEHGTRRLIEGLLAEESLAGRRVALIEDVTTTGDSAFKAVEAARAEGALCELVLTIVDRKEGAEANLAARGLRLIPLLTRADFEV
jgi:orotate phosphoribosyltransferase